MALVSPGINISINDQSQYVNSNIGSVPFVLLATAQNKTYNGRLATGTTKANAGKLQSFTSQRDLVTAMGTPHFQMSSSGSMVNASEISEYGLMTSYSALGLGNQLYAIRADIDLNELVGTSVRPVAAADDGAEWLDLKNTAWGIYELNRATSPAGFDPVLPLQLTDPTQVVNDSSTYANITVPTPRASVGALGDYALPLVTQTGTAAGQIRLFYKAQKISTKGYSAQSNANAWVMVGSADWQRAVPAAVSAGAISGTVGGTQGTDIRLIINGTNITATDLGGNSATLSAGVLAATINNKRIPGVYALAAGNPSLVYLFVTNASSSTGSAANGAMSVGGALGADTVSGLRITGTSNAPYLFYGNYASEPAGGWGVSASDAKPRPSGSVWWKTSAVGNGFDPVVKTYSQATDRWTPLTTPVYQTFADALAQLDPVNGGDAITPGTSFFITTPTDGTYNSLRLINTLRNGVTYITAGQFDPSSQIQGTESFAIAATQPGNAVVPAYTTVTLSGRTAQDVVTAILASGVPYISAAVTSAGAIQVSHAGGGLIFIQPVTAGILSLLGFNAGVGSNFTVNATTGVVLGTNFANQTANVIFSASEPYNPPMDGTYWYYSNPTEVDILVNTGTQWKGYLVAGTDIRNFNLTNTDPNGVIVSASKPVAQSDSTPLNDGDLWLDTSDLINYPKLYRYNTNTGKWSAIDNTDHVSSNGIIFADARWDTNGQSNVASDALPEITKLLSSNYVDLDCPNPTLYPRGMLLFNTRRSGYNVKKFHKNYFNSTAFTPEPNNNGFPVTFPTVRNAWVSASGLDDQEVMHAGSAAQRAIVVAAMKGAVDSNFDVRSDVFSFNLLVAPSYPELIPNLVGLNNDRANTAFVIGDTPMKLVAKAIDITNWNNNVDGKGLSTADPYLGVYYPSGRTNDLSGNTVVVPASHAVLRTFMYNDNVSYPWFAPAGAHRGLISNLSDIGYVDAQSGEWVHNSINQGLRDALYTQQINPLTQLPGTGLCVWGQITKNPFTSARDRVNVVRLENFLRTAFKSVANGYLFEPNDSQTRKSIQKQIENALHDVLSKRGLYDFLVICDTSNNTSSTISNNQLYVDVAIEPVRDVEFIYIPIAIYNPGQIAAK
jgi:hypothetical protein